MRLKVIILVGAIIGILILALFGFGLKDIAVKGVIEDIPEYNCGTGNFCTSCIIDSQSCSCGQNSCDCGNKTVNKTECKLF